jgi:hypothetical protein
MSDDLNDAIERFKLTPDRLTADVALIAKADPDLGKRAREKRAQAQLRDDEIAITGLGLSWPE